MTFDDIHELSPIEILTLTLIGEARGEPIEGMVAVGNVIRNRLRHEPGRYKSYSDVCLARLQFSCWNEDDPNRVLLLSIGEQLLSQKTLTEPSHRQCYWTAKGIDQAMINDNTHGSLNYLTSSLFFSDKRPKWAKSIISYYTFGNQVFFIAD